MARIRDDEEEIEKKGEYMDGVLSQRSFQLFRSAASSG
jgi:hypothetical protein